MDLQNKVFLITGGGSGIGRATAMHAAQAGATVIIADIDPTGGTETVRQLRQTGAEATFLPLDVTRGDDVRQLVGLIVARHGRLDCAFNNAGVEGAPVRTADADEAEFDQIIAINLKGVWLCMKYELQQMIAQGGGAIVNAASVAGLVGAHSMSAYAASKHGVVGLTKTAAVEYARKGVRVNAVCPAVIRTPMVERAIAQLPQLEAGILHLNPSHRLGEVDEVARTVIWLCTSGASFINGAAIAVDGGLTAQ